MALRLPRSSEQCWLRKQTLGTALMAIHGLEIFPWSGDIAGRYMDRRRLSCTPTKVLDSRSAGVLFFVCRIPWKSDSEIAEQHIENIDACFLHSGLNAAGWGIMMHLP